MPKKPGNEKFRGPSKKKKTIKKSKKIKDAKTKEDLLHIVTYNEGGFLIVAADYRSMPILAYSENNDFDIDNYEEVNGLSIWMHEAKEQMSRIKKEEKRYSAFLHEGTSGFPLFGPGSMGFKSL